MDLKLCVEICTESTGNLGTCYKIKGMIILANIYFGNPFYFWVKVKGSASVYYGTKWLRSKLYSCHCSEWCGEGSSSQVAGLERWITWMVAAMMLMEMTQVEAKPSPAILSRITARIISMRNQGSTEAAQHDHIQYKFEMLHIPSKGTHVLYTMNCNWK